MVFFALVRMLRIWYNRHEYRPWGNFIVKNIFIPITMIIAFVCSAEAAVKIKNSTAMRYEEEIMTGDPEIGEDTDAIAILENDIRILDEEIAKCQKQKKGWIAATVIGAAGTVATGVAAGVQGVKLKEKKEEYKETKQEWDTAKKELTKKQQDLEKSKK